MSHEAFIGICTAAATVVSVSALVGQNGSLMVAAISGVIAVALWTLLLLQRDGISLPKREQEEPPEKDG
jgi:hypothetical protein